YQARKRVRLSLWAGCRFRQGARLRPGQGAPRPGRQRPLADRRSSSRRNAGVHGARADTRHRDHRSAFGYLRAWLCRLLARHRTTRVHWSHRDRNVAAPHADPARSAVPTDRAEHSSRARSIDPGLSREASRRPAGDGGRPCRPPREHRDDGALDAGSRARMVGRVPPANQPGACVTSSTRKIVTTALFVAAAACAAVFGQSVALPNQSDSLKFAAIGDNGTGDQPQYEIAQQMTNAHARFPFDLVIMLGDNMYGGQNPADFVKKFERPYATLLAANVKFQASLGNHDRPENVSYAPFNMNGQRYYTYVRRDVRFFALDSTLMDPKQLAWLTSTLKDSRESWKICYFHHPLYSNANRHGSSVDLRLLLEPLFVGYGVNVVFSGHDHVYERIKPQKGIYYFVSG